MWENIYTYMLFMLFPFRITIFMQTIRNNKLKKLKGWDKKRKRFKSSLYQHHSIPCILPIRSCSHHLNKLIHILLFTNLLLFFEDLTNGIQPVMGRRNQSEELEEEPIPIQWQFEEICLMPMYIKNIYINNN